MFGNTSTRRRHHRKRNIRGNVTTSITNLRRLFPSNIIMQHTSKRTQLFIPITRIRRHIRLRQFRKVHRHRSTNIHIRPIHRIRTNHRTQCPSSILQRLRTQPIRRRKHRRTMSRFLIIQQSLHRQRQRRRYNQHQSQVILLLHQPTRPIVVNNQHRT